MLPLVLLLASATLVPSGGAAQAAPETCQGQPATLVGTPGGHLSGTDGPDVIITHGADLNAGAGDDLICVDGLAPVERGGAGVDIVFAGPGDDTVVVTQVGDYYRLAVVLGDGDDTFSGGAGADWVTNRDDGEVDGGADVIATHGGNDHASVGGSSGTLVGDQVDLGSGGDTLYVDDGIPAGASLEGGSGKDELVLGCSGALVVAVPDRSAVCAGSARPQWSGFETYVADVASLSFVGSDRGESLYAGSTERLDVSMRGGDDVVVLTVAAKLHGDVLFGRGRDLLDVDGADKAVAVDLSSGVLRRRGSSAANYAHVGGLEDVTLRRAGSSFVGNAAPNVLRASCLGKPALGRGGDDVLGPLSATSRCALELLGGGGDDVLRGARGNDVLLGGPGRDLANGKGGTDRCVAEAERYCER